MDNKYYKRNEEAENWSNLIAQKNFGIYNKQMDFLNSPEFLAFCNAGFILNTFTMLTNNIQYSTFIPNKY